MHYFKSIIKLILLLLILNNGILLRAQNSETIKLPSLDNHIFTSIAGVKDPFIKTKFILNIGIASLVETEIPVTIQSLDKTINFKPNLFYTVGGIEYQHAINDWAAIHVEAGGLARVGDDAISIATQGISAASLFGIGLMFKLSEEKDMLLSGGLSLNSSSLTYIDLASKFDEIVSDSLTSQQVISNYQILSGNMQFRFAYRFSDIVGLISQASGSFGEIYAEGSKNDFNWAYGVVLSFDFRNWFLIPFGLGLGGSIISNDWQFSETDQPVYTANLNISFINQNDFIVGLENYLQMVNQERFDKTFNFHYSRIYLAYYF